MTEPPKIGDKRLKKIMNTYHPINYFDDDHRALAARLFWAEKEIERLKGKK